MTWDEALNFTTIVQDIAKEWSRRVNNSVSPDDLSQDLMIFLVEKVEITSVTKNVKGYIRSACWYEAYDTLLNPATKASRRMLSLDNLLEHGHYQVSSEKEVFTPHRPITFFKNADVLETSELDLHCTET